MGDLALRLVDGQLDLAIEEDDVAQDGGWKTALLLSVGLDRRAEVDDPIPAGDGDARGWWADQFASVEGDRIGSRGWLLDRSKREPGVVPRAREILREALAWAIEDHAGSVVDVVAEVSGDQLRHQVVLRRPANDPIALRYSHVWDAELAEEGFDPPPAEPASPFAAGPLTTAGSPAARPGLAAGLHSRAAGARDLHFLLVDLGFALH